MLAADLRSNAELDAEIMERERPGGRFKLVPFRNLKLGSASSYAVKRIIPRIGMVLVWGPPKCGKSFWTFDLAMHLALDVEYRGYRVNGGPVAYLAFEGGDGFRARAEAYRRAHDVDGLDIPFYLITTALDLVGEHSELIAAIRSQLGSEAPVAVVLDTLNRSLRGSESSDEDMAAYVRAADAIRDAFRCAVIVVHHCGHDANRPRGHSALLGAVDAQISVTRDGADNIVATVERMKDGPEGTTIVSRLEQVDLGLDEDGDALTSCIIVPSEAGPEPPARPLTGINKIAFDALIRAVLDAGDQPPASNHIPPGMKAVSVELWREYFYNLRPDEAAEAKKKSFQRARDNLQSRSIIGVWGQWVWNAQ